MHTSVENIESAAVELLDQGILLDQIVVFADHPHYPGYLHVEPVDDRIKNEFLAQYHDWMSRLMILNGLHLLDPFVTQLVDDGYHPIFGPSTAELLVKHQRWSEPLNIEGYDLRAFQQFSMNQALERARGGADNTERFYFWNWSAGAGKSYCSGAGAKALLESGDVDVVLAFTLNDLLKDNLCKSWRNDAGLHMTINDHAKPAIRKQEYHLPGDGFVMNYEKLWVDEDALSELTAGRRVLWVLDEGHKLIAEAGQNKARKALDRLTRACKAVVWPMSATVVNGSPLRFRDVFSLDSYSRRNPLGTKQDFTDRYAESVANIPIATKTGGMFTLTKYEWNLAQLHEVRHRVGERTMAVRKTDPGIREQFKGIECLPEWVPMTNQLAELYDVILDDAKLARDRGESREPHYRVMRVASINPAALWFSHDELAQRICQDRPDLCRFQASNKIEMLNDRLGTLREAQDKAVVFCHWTNMGVIPLNDLIQVPHVLHYGDMKARDKIAAQDRFKTDPDITCFLSSDAGTHGLNMQEARYVISVDPVYSYDDLHQRNARIDRADSHLDGLTAYVMITEGSKVENRIWAVCEERRRIAEATQGTVEALTYGVDVSVPETGNTDWLIGLED